ncbi:MAG: Rieske (2Fe-2S) protein [Anaerolineae bacterium]|nr:Rieske (2Fe-2S) protein [Anaerolineae bacterium]MDW7990950.1 Rieske (2Fe-2S) protein [Anaerolineae bacterium]
MWIDVLDEGRLPEGGREVVEVKGVPVLLIRHGGEIFAVGARCPHMGAPLKRGQVTEEGYLVCPLHRSAFSLRTGDVAQWVPWPPGVGKVLGALRRERALPVYPVRVENGRILIQMDAD